MATLESHIKSIVLNQKRERTPKFKVCDVKKVKEDTNKESKLHLDITESMTTERIFEDTLVLAKSLQETIKKNQQTIEAAASPRKGIVATIATVKKIN